MTTIALLLPDRARLPGTLPQAVARALGRADREQFERELRALTEAEQDSKELRSAKRQLLFDPTFDGALSRTRRNQFFPINTFSGFSYGGIERRFSPVNVVLRARPLSTLFADLRFDYDVQRHGIKDVDRGTLMRPNARIRSPSSSLRALGATVAEKLPASISRATSASSRMGRTRARCSA